MLNLFCSCAQIAEDPDTYSDFFHMRRGEGDHVYCVLVCDIRCQRREPHGLQITSCCSSQCWRASAQSVELMPC